MYMYDNIAINFIDFRAKYKVVTHFEPCKPNFVFNPFAPNKE